MASFSASLDILQVVLFFFRIKIPSQQTTLAKSKVQLGRGGVEVLKSRFRLKSENSKVEETRCSGIMNQTRSLQDPNHRATLSLPKPKNLCNFNKESLITSEFFAKRRNSIVKDISDMIIRSLTSSKRSPYSEDPLM